MQILKTTGIVSLAIFLTLTVISIAIPAFAQSDLKTSIKGSWKSVCMDIGDSAYIQTTASFDGAGSSSSNVVFFKDPACAQPTGLSKSDAKVSYSIGPKSGQQNDLELHPIDVTTQTWKLTQNGSIIQSGGALPTQYDVIAIKGDTLYLSGLDRSAKGPITSAANRPTTVDLKNVYHRQK